MTGSGQLGFFLNIEIKEEIFFYNLLNVAFQKQHHKNMNYCTQSSQNILLSHTADWLLAVHLYLRGRG